MPPPPSVRVDVHLLALDAPSKRPEVGTALPAEDLRRAADIRVLPQRHAFLATRTALRELLGARLGCPPAALPIIIDPNGRPRLAGGEMQFSVSHCEGWGAVALSPNSAVGVDVEPIEPLDGIADVVAMFLPVAARTAFATAPPDRQAGVFFQWWTRLEAAVKASGRRLDDAGDVFEGIAYESYEVVPGLALAVAARSDGPLAVAWHAPDLSSRSEPP